MLAIYIDLLSVNLSIAPHLPIQFSFIPDILVLYLGCSKRINQYWRRVRTVRRCASNNKYPILTPILGGSLWVDEWAGWRSIIREGRLGVPSVPYNSHHQLIYFWVKLLQGTSVWPESLEISTFFKCLWSVLWGGRLEDLWRIFQSILVGWPPSRKLFKTSKELSSCRILKL